MPTHYPRLSVTLLPEDYENLKRIAAVENVSISEVSRKYILQGIHGEITQNNIDFLVPIIREQLKSVINPATERLVSINIKTCVQAGAAAYLAAEALSKFVPAEEQMDFEEAYEAARKKAVRYLKGKTDLD